ncbi:MAG: hypothetical protein ACJ78Y_13755, partial [Myxococcales bacterium]
MIRLFVFLALFACTRGGPSGPDARLSRQIVFSPCRLRGIAFPTQCGVLRVPEDRGNAGGRSTEEQASPATGGGHRPEHTTEEQASPATGGGRRP